jgi:hypothetical protein
LSAARRHGGAGLKLVEPVHPPGRSRASPRGDHHPAAAVVGHRPSNAACGKVTLTASSTHGMRDKAPGVSAYCRLSGPELRENAAQLDRWKVVSHPQRSPPPLPTRTATSTSAPSQLGLNACHGFRSPQNTGRIDIHLSDLSCLHSRWSWPATLGSISANGRAFLTRRCLRATCPLAQAEAPLAMPIIAA